MSLKSLTDHQLDTAVFLCLCAFLFFSFIAGSERICPYCTLYSCGSLKGVLLTAAPSLSSNLFACYMIYTTRAPNVQMQQNGRKKRTCLKCLCSGLSIFLAEGFAVLIAPNRNSVCSQHSELRRRHFYPSMGRGVL